MPNYFVDSNIGSACVFRDVFAANIAAPFPLVDYDLTTGESEGAGALSKGGAWEQLTGDSSILVQNLDNAVNLPPKGVRGDAAGSYACVRPYERATGGRYQSDWRWLSARGRILYSNFNAGKYIGIGFCDALGNAMTVGCGTDGANRNLMAIGLTATGGRIQTNILTDTLGGSSFSREAMITIRRDTADFRIYENGVQLGGNRALSPTLPWVATPTTSLFPCLVTCAPVSAAQGIARMIEANYFAIFPWSGGTPAAQVEIKPVWTPINKSDYMFSQALNFALAGTYSVALSTTLDGSKRIKARDMVLDTYGTGGTVQVVIDGITVTIPADRELVLAAPDKPSIDISGFGGQARLRLYTVPYSMYQRS